ncbi:hypothetical protein Tco_1491335 [Tanacetum coccineum]
MVDDMLKAQSKVIDILCNLELIYPPAFFDIMIHLVIHLPLEDVTTKFNRPDRNVDCPPPTEFPNKDMKEEFPDWFGKQILSTSLTRPRLINDSRRVIAWPCGPAQDFKLSHSCVVNGVRCQLNVRTGSRVTVEGYDRPTSITDPVRLASPQMDPTLATNLCRASSAPAKGSTMSRRLLSKKGYWVPEEDWTYDLEAPHTRNVPIAQY